MANETYNILQGIFNGQTPIQRSEPMSGQSEYYYMKPNQNSYTPLSQMQTVDVPSATTPNPYLTEEKNAQYSQNTFGDYFAKNITDKNLTDKHVENIMNIARSGDFRLDRAVQSIKNTAKDIAFGAKIPFETIWNSGEAVGELAADAHIAYQYLDKMNKAGDMLVKKYGSGAANGTDNYYHPLLQCELARISPTSKEYGLRLGYLKEVYDFHNKKGKKPYKTIVSDMRKDLQNNLYGSNITDIYSSIPCEVLLDDKRTKNMRKAGIK